jgi:N-acetylglutamate synthase-like GNAT family acetyltransferase
MEIRQYRPSDRDGVIALILPIQQREFGIPITLDAQPDLRAIPEYYQRARSNFWVAIADDTVVGTISLLDIGDDSGALRKMFVAKTHRGGDRGVARALLDALLEHCAMHGIVRVYLGTTAAFTAAHRFYEKNGFDTILPQDLPASFPIMKVDTRFYVRSLA